MKTVRTIASNRILVLPALLMLSATISACGSDGGSDAEPASPANQTPTKTTGKSGSTGKSGNAGEKEMTPDEKAPRSAGDKRESAPDDVISDRPGGSNGSVSR